MQPLAFIPSPSQGVWHLGPFPIRAYALMIILGIVVAVWLGERRWTARGGTPGVVVDCAVWAVPFGLVGGRLYHVITDYQRYFGDGRNPVNALRVWEGGLGIWGAVVLGGVGAWIGCRRRGVSVAAFGDAVAPGIALAQAIGRWGNWWNQELYGRPLGTWWAVKIDPAHRPMLDDGSPDPKYADVATYHPTFLYESLWCVGVAVLVIWAGKRFRLTHGRTFALYVAAYTVGRAWIEFLRIDDAHHIAGLRLNDWTALLVFAGAVAYIWRTRTATAPEAVTVTGRYAESAETAEGVPAEAAPVEAAAAEVAEGEQADEEGKEDTEGAAAIAVTGESIAEPAEPAEPAEAAESAESAEAEAPRAGDAETAQEEIPAEEPAAPEPVIEEPADTGAAEPAGESESDGSESGTSGAGDSGEVAAEVTAEEGGPAATELTAEGADAGQAGTAQQAEKAGAAGAKGKAED